MNTTRSTSYSGYLVSVPRGDRWQVHQRLQELNVSCACLNDGTLQVDVNTPVALIQLWSVIYQLTASRQQLLSWLERCW